jgi:hypothetical protein
MIINLYLVFIGSHENDQKIQNKKGLDNQWSIALFDAVQFGQFFLSRHYIHVRRFDVVFNLLQHLSLLGNQRTHFTKQVSQFP